MGDSRDELTPEQLEAAEAMGVLAAEVLLEKLKDLDNDQTDDAPTSGADPYSG